LHIILGWWDLELLGLWCSLTIFQI
jgi:hypothetical protein